MKRALEDAENTTPCKKIRDENNNIGESATELQSLHQYALDAIFCHLSLNDVCSLSEAGMRDSTGDYFKRKYKSKRISVRMERGEIHVKPQERYVHCFAEYIQDVNIFGDDIKLFKYVASILNSSPKKIRFTHLKHSWTTAEIHYGECLKETLKNVEIVEFNVSRLSGKFFNSILKHCKNMKSLRIRSYNEKEDRVYNLRSNWFYQKYPTLESIQWDDGVKYQTKELKAFFNNNPNVKNFTVARNARNALQFLLDSDIQLNELTVLCRLHNKRYSSCNIGYVCDLVKTLYVQKKIKQFHLVPTGSKYILNHSMGKLSSLEALETIFLVHCSFGRASLIPSIASLSNLRTLYIHSLGANAEILAEKLTKLEELYVEKDSIEMIVPFAMKSLNMKRVALTNTIGNVTQLDIWNLIKKRKLHQIATKLDVFIEETALVKLPGALNIDYAELINFKRFESLHIDHPFYNYREADWTTTINDYKKAIFILILFSTIPNFGYLFE